jgi:putative phosphoesterase
MKVAAIYDVHGNLPALQAVIDDIHAAQVEEIIVGGDLLPGPLPRETLDFLRSVNTPIRLIHGNGDRAVLDVMRGNEPTSVPPHFREIIEWNAQKLSDEHRDWMATWPSTLTMNIDGVGRVLFCHATPQNDTDIFSRNTPAEALLPLFEPLGVDVVVCGHTHMQFDRMVGTTRVVNAGSVGMPFGRPGAYWFLLNGEVELKRTAYDLSRAADVIRATDYPIAEQFASTNILSPPSEESILAVYDNSDARIR